MPRWFDVATSFGATGLRLGVGRTARPALLQPRALLELYEFEGCPFCRKVREVLSVLDLDVRIFPCPKGGDRFRSRVPRRDGRLRFPYLVDPNEGRDLFESDEIVRYLADTYGGRAPLRSRLGTLTDASSALASWVRLGAGVFRRPSREPARPLELWSFEASPYCRLVREALSRLELPYVLHNVAKGSPKREELARLAGRVQVPWLMDPNTGVTMFESADLVAYLTSTYALG